MLLRLSPRRSAPPSASDQVLIPPDMDGVPPAFGRLVAPPGTGVASPGGREDLSRAPDEATGHYVAHATGKSGQAFPAAAKRAIQVTGSLFGFEHPLSEPDGP